MLPDRTRGFRTPAALLGALAVVAALVTGCAPVTAHDASGPAVVAAAATGAAVTNTLTVGGLERSYLLRTPVRASDDPMPLLIVIHGAGGNADRAELATGITQLSDADGFIVAYPNGTQAADIPGELSWNAGVCCGRPVIDQIDDVAFIAATIADISEKEPVDASRIYVAGFSNGGMLAHRLACELPGRIAGIAVVAGALNVSDCAAEGVTSVLMMHGTGDLTVPYQGGATNERTAKRFGTWTNAPLSRAVSFWTGQDACGSSPKTSEKNGVTRTTYEACADGAKVDVITIRDGGHIWPIETKSGIDASTFITEYFGLGKPVATLAQ